MPALLPHQGFRPHLHAFADKVGTLRGTWVGVVGYAQCRVPIGTGLILLIDQMQGIGMGGVKAIDALYTDRRVSPSIADVIDKIRCDHTSPSDRQVLRVRRIDLGSPLSNVSNGLCLILVGEPDEDAVFGRDRVIESAALLIPVIDGRCNVMDIRRVVQVGAIRRRVQRQNLLADRIPVRAWNLVAWERCVATSAQRYLRTDELLGNSAKVALLHRRRGNVVVCVCGTDQPESLIVGEEKHLVLLDWTAY